MEEKLFVYCLLKDANVQKEVIGRTVNTEPEIIEGYKKSTIEIEGETFPCIIPYQQGSIDGFVISITQEELKLIDEYETDAYERKKVVLKSGKSAWVYQKRE